MQQARAAAGRGHHVVDASGAVRYVDQTSTTPAVDPQGKITHIPKSSITEINPSASNVTYNPPAQNQSAFDQAKANLLKMNPNLGVAGHEDNTRFIQNLKNTYGENYREQMQKNPALLAKSYTASFPSSQNTASGQPASSVAESQAPVSAGLQPAVQAPRGAAAMGMPRQASTAPAAPNVHIPGSGQHKTGEQIHTENLSLDSVFSEIEKRAMSGDPFCEGVVREINLQAEKVAELSKSAEQRYMQYLNKELKKLAAFSSSSYSEEQIDRFTKDTTSFEKAAHTEAKLVWEGMVEELRKQGADQAFIDGMTKEALNIRGLANAGNLAYNMLRGGLFDKDTWKGLGALGKGVAQNLGRENATQRVLQSHGGSLGALTDTAGKFVHAPEFAAKGSRSIGLADYVQQAVPDVLKKNRNAQTALEDLRRGGLEQFGKELATENRGLLENAYLNKLDDAKYGVGAAKGDALNAIGRIERGDLSPLTKNLSAGSVKEVASVLGKKPGDVAPGHAELPSVISKLQSHAEEVRKTPGGAANASPLGDVASHIASGKRNAGGAWRLSPWEGVKGAFGGGMLGTMVAPVFGPLAPAVPFIGAGIGGMYKTFGPAGALAATGAGLYGGKKLLGGLGIGGAGQQTDSTGLQQDRHRIVPFMSNRATGAIGGALLSMLIAREMGLTGAAGMVAPILGGIAGYNYLPEMMNKWKDPYGTGANQMNPFAAAYNRANPYVGEAEAPQSYSAALPTEPAPQPYRMTPLGH